MHRVDLTPEEQEDLKYSCPWNSGGWSYDNPPEYCDLEKAADADYCPKHLELDRKLTEADDAMDRLRAEED